MKTILIPDTLTGFSIGNKTVSNLFAGFFAGTCAKTVVYPFDVMRKRLQIQGFNDVRKNFGKVSSILATHIHKAKHAHRIMQK